MSRGPGRVQQAIQAIFASAPRSTFTVEDLAGLIYPGSPVEKKHRVAILRAAALMGVTTTKVEPDGRSGFDAGAGSLWVAWLSERRGGSVLFFNCLNVASYASARIRVERNCSQAEAEKKFASHREAIAPDGTWTRRVEIVRARHAGDDKLAAKLQKQADAELTRLSSSLKVAQAGPQQGDEDLAARVAVLERFMNSFEAKQA